MTIDCTYLYLLVIRAARECVIFAYVVIREASSEEKFSILTIKCWTRMKLYKW